MNWATALKLAFKRAGLTLAAGIVLIAGGVTVSQCSGLPAWALPSWAVPFVEPPPFACEGLHGLVIYDEGARLQMPPAQIAAFEGADVIDWTQANAKAFLKLDKDASEGDLSEKWVRDAWQSYKDKSKGVLPWVVISNGKSGTSQAFPDNPAAAIELLSKYGAAK